MGIEKCLMKKMNCSFFISVTAVIASLYALKRYFYKNRWIPIGTLKQIFIYPLDGGIGQEIHEAHCWKNGFKSANMIDRSLIICSEENNSAILHLKAPELASKNIEGILQHFNSDSFKILPYNPREINYLGDPIKIRYYANRNLLQNFLQNIMGQLNICYVPPTNRKEFNNRVKSEIVTKRDKVVDKFSSNYSSYTLINTTSLESLKNHTGIEDIRLDNFRPHFVIEGIYPYCEDQVKSLKIGSVEFDSIIPCSHTDFINYRVCKGEKPYSVLQRIRALKKLHPKLSSSNSPVFGINMELAKQGGIAVGDQIYAKF